MRSRSASITVGGADAGGAHRLRGYFLAVFAALSWATGGVVAKWIFTAPGPQTTGWPFPPLGLDIAPVELAASRATVGFLMLVIYVGLTRRGALRLARPVRDLLFLGAFGVFGLALVHFTYFQAIALTDVATAILLEYLAPVLVLMVSVAALGERFTWSLPVAVGLSVLGCAMVVGAVGGGGLEVSPGGLFWGLASALFFAVYTLMGKYAANRYSAWTLLTYGLGAAMLFWFAYLGGPATVIRVVSDPRGAAAVLFIAFVSTVVPFGVFLKALAYIDATKASVTATLEPFIAGLAAWWLLGETLTGLQLVGGLLVVAAILVAQRPVRPRPDIPPLG
ncbi:MAG: DMT family transporter [Anaerosomatales bacterium]|nr:DMT family transporter [Anaerosomatales bacterium]